VTHPFASRGWLDALREELVLALAGLPAEVSFSFGERYVEGQDRSRGWHVRHEAGTTSFVPLPAADVDAELVIDLEVARRLCSPMTPALRQLQREALRDGRIQWRGDPSGLPSALTALHDRMAELTSRS
jgi:hypothetical protein